MPGKAKLFLAIGAIGAALAVALGAFGAHALKARLGVDALAVYQTAVQYHFYHAFGLMIIGLTAWWRPTSYIVGAGWLMVAGIIVFSGSLYLLVISGIRAFGMATPLGGLTLIAAWAIFAVGVLRQPIGVVTNGDRP